MIIFAIVACLQVVVGGDFSFWTAVVPSGFVFFCSIAFDCIKLDCVVLICKIVGVLLGCFGSFGACFFLL